MVVTLLMFIFFFLFHRGLDIGQHNSSHRMTPVTRSGPATYRDSDYMRFMPGDYNYLDPNYMPATWLHVLVVSSQACVLMLRKISQVSLNLFNVQVKWTLCKQHHIIVGLGWTRRSSHRNPTKLHIDWYYHEIQDFSTHDSSQSLWKMVAQKSLGSKKATISLDKMLRKVPWVLLNLFNVHIE